MNLHSHNSKLRKALEKIFLKYETFEYLTTDPIEFPRSYPDRLDQEISAFIAALFSYGNVTAIKNHLKHLFSLCGNSPHSFLLKNNLNTIRKELRPYRFQKSADIFLFLQTLQVMIQNIDNHSLESLFALPSPNEFLLSPKDQSSLFQGGPLRRRILSFQLRFRSRSYKINPKQTESYGYKFLVGQGPSTSSLKRYAMYLRWMVRKEFPDLGIYTSIPMWELLFPLDIHIQRIASVLEISSRQTADWRKAEEITDFFAKLYPTDPVRADFALSRLGILRKCKTKYKAELCEVCEIRSICRIYDQFHKNLQTRESKKGR
ncbi:TIGR02757 family protein [Leptospira sp. WS92.C1]